MYYWIRIIIRGWSTMSLKLVWNIWWGGDDRIGENCVSDWFRTDDVKSCRQCHASVWVFFLQRFFSTLLPVVKHINHNRQLLYYVVLRHRFFSMLTRKYPELLGQLFPRLEVRGDFGVGELFVWRFCHCSHSDGQQHADFDFLVPHLYHLWLYHFLLHRHLVVPFPENEWKCIIVCFRFRRAQMNGWKSKKDLHPNFPEQ